HWCHRVPSRRQSGSDRVLGAFPAVPSPSTRSTATRARSAHRHGAPTGGPRSCQIRLAQQVRETLAVHEHITLTCAGLPAPVEPRDTERAVRVRRLDGGLVQPLSERVPRLVLGLDDDRAVEGSDVDVAAVVLAVQRLPAWPDTLVGEVVLDLRGPLGALGSLLAHALFLSSRSIT